MTRRSKTVIRVSAVERCILALLLLAFPDVVMGFITGSQPRPPAWLARVLGARLLTQGLLEYTRPQKVVVLTAAVVDALHATSMATVATLSPRYRRLAVASLAEASLAEVLTSALARQLP